MIKIIIFIVLIVVGFELIEHVIFPLVVYLVKGKKKVSTGKDGMIGEIARVKQWKEKEGKVFIHGELWWASSDHEFLPGDKVTVEEVNGLKLQVKPWDKNQSRKRGC